MKIEYLIRQNFGGQKCCKFTLLPKILSAEKFCPPKIMSAEIFCKLKFKIYPVPSKHIKIISNIQKKKCIVKNAYEYTKFKYVHYLHFKNWIVYTHEHSHTHMHSHQHTHIHNRLSHTYTYMDIHTQDKRTYKFMQISWLDGWVFIISNSC